MITINLSPAIAKALLFLYHVLLQGLPPWLLRQLLLKYALPSDLDGSEPLDQWCNRLVGYFLPGLLGIGIAAWVDTAKPTVFGLTVRALEVMGSSV